MQWTFKYQPKDIDEIEGNPTPVKEMKEWAQSWTTDSDPLLLVGPPGTGKTTAALALANTMNWQVLETNASDLRNKKSINRTAGVASQMKTLSGGRRMILFDEIDGLFRQDYGGASAVNKTIKETRSPIVLTANDAYASSLKTIRKKCKKIKFKRIHPSTVQKILTNICEKEGIDAEEKALKKIAKNCSGDIKSAVNDLQAAGQGAEKLSEEELGILGNRDREESVFKALRTIFKKKDVQKARDAFEEAGETPEMFFNWVEENIPREYEEEDLIRAMEELSLADLFNSRIIKRQNWTLLKYVIFLFTAGVSAAKEETPHGYTRYQFPSFIKKLSRTKSKRSKLDGIAKRIGKETHSSPHDVLVDDWFLYKKLFSSKETAEELADEFELTKKELSFLKKQAVK